MSAFKAQVRQTMDLIDADAKALKMLTNRDGETFESWVLKHENERKRYEKDVLTGYPPPQRAAASVQTWESRLAYAEQQAAVASAFRKRAVAVCRAILGKRGIRATESESEARTWEQDEEVKRWDALVATLREWIYEVRGREKALPHREGRDRN